MQETKYLIEKYLNQICKQLKMIAFDDKTDLNQIKDFFITTRKAYGKTGILMFLLFNQHYYSAGAVFLVLFFG